MVGEVITGLGLFKSMMDMAKGLKDINDAVVRNSVIIVLQEKILAAREQQSALAERVRELEKEVAEAKAWESEKQCYELQAVDRGAFAYVLKPEMQGSEPRHWLCANCYNKGHKAFLQFREQLRTPSGGRSNQSRWICGSCKSEVTAQYNKKP